MWLATALTACPFPDISAALTKITLSLTHVGPGFAQLFQHEGTFQKVRIFLSEKEEAVQVMAATVKCLS